MSVKLSPIGRVSWPYVFTPNEYEGKTNFEITLLFDKDNVDLSAMKEAAKAVADAKWGVGKRPPVKFVSPFQDGDVKVELGSGPEYKNMVAVKFKRGVKNGRPQVVGKNPAINIEENSGEFYPGCNARVTYTVFAWDGKAKGEGGVSFGLNNVQKVGDGEPFGSRTNAVDDFDALEDNTSGDDLF